MYVFIYFCLHNAACEILVPRPGIEPMPSAVEGRSLNHWTTREVPWLPCFYLQALPLFPALPIPWSLLYSFLHGICPHLTYCVVKG